VFHQSDDGDVLRFQRPKGLTTLKLVLDPVILLTLRRAILEDLAFAAFRSFCNFEAIATASRWNLKSHWRVFNNDLVLLEDSRSIDLLIILEVDI